LSRSAKIGRFSQLKLAENSICCVEVFQSGPSGSMSQCQKTPCGMLWIRNSVPSCSCRGAAISILRYAGISPMPSLACKTSTRSRAVESPQHGAAKNEPLAIVRRPSVYWSTKSILHRAGLTRKMAGISGHCERFVFFCRAVLEAIRLLACASILHANDWQSGLIRRMRRSNIAACPATNNSARCLRSTTWPSRSLHWTCATG